MTRLNVVYAEGFVVTGVPNIRNISGNVTVTLPVASDIYISNYFTITLEYALFP